MKFRVRFYKEKQSGGRAITPSLLYSDSAELAGLKHKGYFLIFVWWRWGLYFSYANKST